MIKIQESSASHGWWMNVDSKEIREVEDEHYGWIADNIEKLLPDISDLDKAILHIGRMTGDTFDSLLDDYYEDEEDSSKEKDSKLLSSLLSRYEAKDLQNRLFKLQHIIDRDFIRSRFYDKNIFIQVYDFTQEYYNAAIEFLQKILRQFPKIKSVTVDNYRGKVIWDGIPIDDALNSKSFQKY